MNFYKDSLEPATPKSENINNPGSSKFRKYKISTLETKIKILLPKVFNEYQIDDVDDLIEHLTHEDKKVYNDISNMICEKIIVSSDKTDTSEAIKLSIYLRYYRQYFLEDKKATDRIIDSLFAPEDENFNRKSSLIPEIKKIQIKNLNLIKYYRQYFLEDKKATDRVIDSLFAPEDENFNRKSSLIPEIKKIQIKNLNLIKHNKNFLDNKINQHKID